MSRVMIITRDYPPTQSGLADHTALLVRLLKTEFGAITVVFQKRTLESGYTVQQFPSQNRVDTFCYEELRHVTTAVKMAIQFAKPDIVILQYVPHMWGRAGVAPRTALVPRWIERGYNIPVVTFLHELSYDWSMNPKRAALSFIHRLQLLTMCLHSRGLAVTNEYRRTRMARLWSRKVVKIPAGNVSARNDIGVTESPYTWPYITWYGTLSDGQRLETLVHAFCKASQHIPALRLVLVGAFDVGSFFIKNVIGVCRRHNIEDRLVVEGYVGEDRLSAILCGAVANIHVNSSGPSGRRTVIAAYLRSGRPVVSVTGYECDPEFVHLKNIWLVSDEVEEMATAIRSLYFDTELQRVLQAGAERLFQQEFSDSAVRNKLLKLLELGTKRARWSRDAASIF